MANLADIGQAVEGLHAAEAQVIEAKKRIDEIVLAVADAVCAADDVREVVSQIYWSWPEVNVKSIAAAFGLKSYQVTQLAGPVAMTGVPCSVCGNELIAANRTQLQAIVGSTSANSNRRRYAARTGLICGDCSQVRTEEREREWQRRRHEVSERLSELSSMNYREYLRTPEWQATRRYHLRRSGYRCQLCNQGGQLEVHHRTYERRGNERFEDLIVLCTNCHARFHDSLPGGPFG